MKQHLKPPIRERFIERFETNLNVSANLHKKSGFICQSNKEKKELALKKCFFI